MPQCVFLWKIDFYLLCFLLLQKMTMSNFQVSCLQHGNDDLRLSDFCLQMHFSCTCLLLPQWFLAMTFANHAQKVWRWPFKKTPSTKLIMHCQKKTFSELILKSLMSRYVKCLSFLWMFHYNIVSQGNLPDYPWP